MCRDSHNHHSDHTNAVIKASQLTGTFLPLRCGNDNGKLMVNFQGILELLPQEFAFLNEYSRIKQFKMVQDDPEGPGAR